MRLTVFENNGQNSVTKEQDQRRHGIHRSLKRETACPRLMSDAFQPPCNFDPESRATPTITFIPKEIRAGVSNNADANVKQTGCLYKVGPFYCRACSRLILRIGTSTFADCKFGAISGLQLTATMELKAVLYIEPRHKTEYPC